MAENAQTLLPTVIEKHHKQLLDEWLVQQRASLSGEDFREEASQFLAELRKAITHGQSRDIQSREWAPTLELLANFSRARAIKGLTASQMAIFVFSLKKPLFALLRREFGTDSVRLADESWAANELIDDLGLYTTEVYQKSREDVIVRQQEELLELSTPVVQLWDGILALPLIGTLDSARTQVVMENLLQRIVELGAEIAIIDITGVPTVDTLVAQHLIKTISAARLMGADCIISGIRPQIAQTIVHLGVELSVTSKATMADALMLAFRRLGKVVVERAKPVGAAE